MVEVDRVYSGESEVGRKEGLTRNSTLYRNKKTDEYFEFYWAQGCGDAYNLPVENPVRWLVNVDDNRERSASLIVTRLERLDMRRAVETFFVSERGCTCSR